MEMKIRSIKKGGTKNYIKSKEEKKKSRGTKTVEGRARLREKGEKQTHEKRGNDF
jgi:hypothetical protein